MPGTDEPEMGGSGGTLPDSEEGVSEDSLLLSFSLFFTDAMGLSAIVSISWNTPSRRNVGLYNSGILASKISTNCKAPMTSEG